MARVAVFKDQPSPRHWRQFDEDTEVLIEYLGKPAAIELNKEVDRIVARTGGDRQFIWGRELAKRCVHGWRHIDREKKPDHPGLVMPDGAPIPYNTANRDMMMQHCREFSIFVNEEAIDPKAALELLHEDEARADAKND